MTNFEKWKNGLTKDDFYAGGQTGGSPVLNDKRIILDCFRCPASSYCAKHLFEKKCVVDDMTVLKSCGDVFREWANAEAAAEPAESKGETCPKCGSDTVIITRAETRRCSKCGCPVGETR